MFVIPAAFLLLKNRLSDFLVLEYLVSCRVLVSVQRA